MEAMEALIGSVTDVVTGAAGWIGTFAGQIADVPLLTLAVVGVPLCGLGVGLLKRLLSARA